MSVNDTPYDVWSAVSTYLSNRDVEKLCGVNKQLRPVGLDARFRDVKFSKHDSKMKRLCEMLCRDEIAVRVRRLTVEPWLVQPRTKTYVSKSENLWNRINTVFNPRYMEQEAQKRVEKRVEKDIRRITGAVKHLENIHEYQVLYDERGGIYHRQLVEALLSPALEAFGSRLTSLTIKVPFEFLQHLSYVRLPQLQVLNVYICTGDATMDQVKYALDGFFVFIHNLRSLEDFGLSATSSSRDLDLSYFSERWGKFPRLKAFSLSIPFNGGFLSSPEGFYEHVLKPHCGTLEKLKLSATCAGPSRHPLPEDCQLWVRRILKSSFGTMFPRLREVELALRPLKTELTDLYEYLRLRAPILEKLTLTDRALTYPEMEKLTQTLCAPQGHLSGQNLSLNSLRVKVDALSPELFLLIARRFPNLRILALSFGGVHRGVHDMKHIEQDPHLTLTAFDQALRQHSSTVFDAWSLDNIYLDAYSPSLIGINPLMQLLRRNFPSTVHVYESAP